MDESPRAGQIVMYHTPGGRVLPAIVLMANGDSLDLEVFGLDSDTTERMPKNVPLANAHNEDPGQDSGGVNTWWYP